MTLKVKGQSFMIHQIRKMIGQSVFNTTFVTVRFIWYTAKRIRAFVLLLITLFLHVELKKD